MIPPQLVEQKPICAIQSDGVYKRTFAANQRVDWWQQVFPHLVVLYSVTCHITVNLKSVSSTSLIFPSELIQHFFYQIYLLVLSKIIALHQNVANCYNLFTVLTQMDKLFQDVQMGPIC